MSYNIYARTINNIKMCFNIIINFVRIRETYNKNVTFVGDIRVILG